MEEDSDNMQNKMTGEEIVVTGMSGVFPNSDSVQEFMENLYNKVDMVSVDTSLGTSNPDVPKHCGKVNGMEKFDAQFFKVGYDRVKTMEPMSRQILEHSYGAIFDSGNTHLSLKDKVVGVFIGSSYADYSVFCMYDVSKGSNSFVSGTSKSMIANRVSYWMDAKGPSYCIDYSCASSSAALEHAYKSLKAGDCDAAVVSGSNRCIFPSLTTNIKRAGLLCLDGKTKCFDKNGDGYVRSDAVSVIFLQKAKDAKRVYAEVYHAEGAYQLKGNDKFLPLRKSDELQKFFNDVYSKTDIDPKDVEYVEANGAALFEADHNEVEAIANVFSGDKAVKIGSVKSNMGHSEPASGLCSLTKLCLAYHKGEIAANLHLQEPVESAQDGKVQIVTENTKFDRGYTALNNMSFTGANYHVILKGHYKNKNLEQYKSQVPRIVLASGRQESGVTRIFDALKSKQVDAEEIALLHNIFENDIVGHMGRGYTILDTIKESTVVVSESVEYYSGVKPPLWFVFSGMGSQWAGMGTDFMRIPTFAAAIERCHQVLMPLGIDIVKVITDPNNKFDNIIHAFVGIGAVQIGLINILKELGIVPDYFIGHSLGENACAYQDDTITPEQMILCAYSRGKATMECKLKKGLMAAVGMGYKALVKQSPPEIDIGCHNSSESSTISGPADVINEFVADLTKRGIFTRIVPSANIAYHSRYVADVGPALLQFLRDILKDPKPRSDKWISTSVPRERWDEPAAKYSSAEYHTNNLLVSTLLTGFTAHEFKNSVLFEETISLIPENAVVVEIAPHGLLQAILKRSHKNCTHIPLTRRGNADSVKFLLEAIGKLYISGFNPKVEILYPKIEFPVATETPLLSHLVEWEHSEDWPLTTYKKNKHMTAASRNIVFSLHDDEFKYLVGYNRNGVNVLPEAVLLAFIWETLAMYQGTDFQEFSVVFKDIQFHSEIIVTAETPVRLSVLINKGNNYFELTHEDKLATSGVVYGVKTIRFQDKIQKHDEPFNEFETDINLTSQDIYKVLKMRGFDYREQFQSIFSSNLDRTKALIKWTEHWIPFIDSMIQLNTVSRDYTGISKPKFIRTLRISAHEQADGLYETVNGLKCYHAQINKTYGMIRCAGVQIEDITYTDVPLEENTVGVIDSQTFTPYYPTEEVNMNTAIEVNMQIISENSKSKYINLINVVADMVPEEFAYIDTVVDKLIMLNTEIKTVNVKNDELLTAIQNHEDYDKANVIILENLLQNSKKMKEVQNIISKDTFILSLEDTVPKKQSVKDYFTILSCMSDGKKILILMKSLNNKDKDTSFIPIRFDDTFSWVPDVYRKLVTTKRVVLISERQSHSGILGFVKKLIAAGHNNVSVVIVDDLNAPKFDLDNDLYKDQLQKNMTINIMRKGQWGTLYLKSSKKLQNQTSFVLKNLVPGDLENVSWVEAPKISGDKTLAQVCYSGLSLYDLDKVLNVNKNIYSLGMDFSGIDKNGDKVMGLIHGGSAASAVETDPDLLWPVPDHWSLEEAATVPLAYVQAYYCLTIRSQLRKGKRILICDATNSVGLALISLSLSYNFTIFTVVDSDEKKKTLLSLYPQLKEKNIICSDNDSFSSTFLSNNNGKRCEYVINFATGSCRKAAAECVATYGFFVDFSKHDIYENESMGMSFLCNERSYMNVDVFNIFRPQFSGDRKVLQKLIKQGIESGVVKPLSRLVYSPLQAAKALRVLSLNQHIGKVLIRIRDPNIMSNGLETIPRMLYSPQDVLIIVCDEKGIGLELADRLIERGARKIILHFTKTSSVTGYVHTKMLTWSKQEVSIKVSADNLQTEKGSATFMKNAMKFGKVKGVFVVFDTKHTDNGIKDDFINAFKKQSLVVMNLDVASRICVDLSHFIVLSRFAQSASDEYSLSMTEETCDKRNELGLPTLVVRYESLDELDDESTNKTKPQTISALFNAIETSLKLKYTNILTYELKKKTKENIIEKGPEQDGLYAFYKYVDTEEDNVTAQPIVELLTLLNNGINTDWDSSDSYIIMLPGFEGRPQIFETVAERLKLRSVSIQLGPDLEGGCIETIARNAREELRECFGDSVEKEDRRDKKFYIVGYSFGVNIALELAAILEGEGKIGVIYCIDSSPDTLLATIETVLGDVSEDQLQNNVLNHMYNLITGNTDKELKVDLEAFSSFDAKVKECVKRMKEVTYSKQYKKLVLESAYNRIVMAKQYKPEFKLRSQLILMKSSKHMCSLPDDYNLSKFSQKPVKVFPLLAIDPASALYDPRVSNIINMHLDQELIDEFKKKNLCDLY